MPFRTGFETLAADPSRPGVVFGLADRTLYRSDDSGKSWTRIAVVGRRFVSDLVIDPSDSARLFAATYDGRILRSLDGGRAWDLFGPGLGTAIHALAVSESPPALLYAMTRNGVFTLIDVE